MNEIDVVKVLASYPQLSRTCSTYMELVKKTGRVLRAETPFFVDIGGGCLHHGNIYRPEVCPPQLAQYDLGDELLFIGYLIASNRISVEGIRLLETWNQKFPEQLQALYHEHPPLNADAHEAHRLY